MKTDEVEMKWNSLHGEMEKSFFWNGKSLALDVSTFSGSMVRLVNGRKTTACYTATISCDYYGLFVVDPGSPP